MGVGVAAVAAAKFTLPSDWPSTRIWTGQAWSGPGVADVQIAEPEKLITTSLVFAGVANEVNAVGMKPAVVAETGPNCALPAAIAATGCRGRSALAT